MTHLFVVRLDRARGAGFFPSFPRECEVCRYTRRWCNRQRLLRRKNGSGLRWRRSARLRHAQMDFKSVVFQSLFVCFEKFAGRDEIRQFDLGESCRTRMISARFCVVSPPVSNPVTDAAGGFKTRGGMGGVEAEQGLLTHG